MAYCLSKPARTLDIPVYIFSQIPKLPILLEQSSVPEINLISVQCPGNFEEDGVLLDPHISFIKDCEVAICDPILLEKLYMYMPNLKWVHCTWAGIENLIEAVPEKPSFVVTRHAGKRFCGAMADYVVCHILNCERSTKLFYKCQDTKAWLTTPDISEYRTLDQIIVGILGVGNMASEIAHFLQARGTIVIGFARRPRELTKRGEFNCILTNLEEVLAASDYICNTLPSTTLTRGLLNCSVLQKCTKKPVFINVGRSDIISEDELINAIRNELLSGAVLDVFENEPLPESSKLWDMPEVTITPHIAAVSRAKDVAEEFYLNFKRYIAGSQLENVVDWSAGY